jgi:catechol 2,3-dioxygenase-like lactoylglutathione lyase family enzyme
MKNMKDNLKISHIHSRPHIVGLSHIGLYVENMEKSLNFYTGFLGMEEQFQLTEPSGKLALKFIKINDRQSIELFPEKSPSDDRLYQVALIVEDIEAMRVHLKNNGVTVPDKFNKGRIGNLSFTAKDPDGHNIEFVQYTPEGWTTQDTGKHLGKQRISARLKHIGFTVKRLEASLAFYRDILGCTETWRGNPPDAKTLSWVNMRLPDSDDYLELMLYDEQPSRERLGIMNHMSLEVSDLPASAEYLAQRATEGLYARPIQAKTGINKKRQVNLFDPDGTRTELMEPWTIDGLSPPFSTLPAPI